MGVDTKLFVAAKEEKILDIMPKLISRLNESVRAELDTYWKREGFDSRMQFIFKNKEEKTHKEFTNGVSVHTNNFESFNITFKVHGEVRSLFISHRCSCSYADTYVGEKIIFSLGCRGMSHEIMMTVADVVKDYGDVYYTYNDSEKDFELLETQTVV